MRPGWGSAGAHAQFWPTLPTPLAFGEAAIPLREGKITLSG
jgi:hypothetical protein